MPVTINGTTGIAGVDGSASTPAVQGTDTNTGIFFPAADTIAFGEGGAEVARFDSSGNLGIGTNSPTQRLDAVAANSQIHFGAATTGGGYLMSTANGQFRISGGAVWDGSNWIAKSTTASIIGDDATGDIKFLSNTSLTAGNTFTPTERMRIDSSGNVGIGTTTMTRNFNIGNSTAAVGMNMNNTGTSGRSYSIFSTNNVAAVAGALAFYDDTAGAYRMVIDSSGKVGIGATSSLEKLTVAASGTDVYLKVTDGTVSNYFGVNLSATAISGTVTNHPYAFFTNNAERARIPSGGGFLIGKTTTALGTAGLSFSSAGQANITVSADDVMQLNRLANDGNLIRFYQDTTEEGNISVSGTTVSYNGGHLSRYAQTQGSKDESLLKGTVLSNLDEMNVYVAPTTYWTEKEELPEGVSVGDVKVETHTIDNEQLNKVKVSDVEGDVNVAGVFVNWYYDEQHQVDEINMAMTGDMIIRIAQGVVVQKGDLLMSAGDGTAKPQGDDIVRSKTVAKVTSNHVTCTYEDGSYCVPCVLMAC